MAQKRKSVKLKKYSLVDTKREKQFKKWKLFICSLIKIPVLHRYNFVYSIDYYAGKLNKDDVIVDQKGVVFMVASDQNNMAIIITHEPKSEQPKMHGMFFIIENPHDKKGKKNGSLKIIKN